MQAVSLRSARYNRDLLRELPRLAWETIREVYQAVLHRGDVTPGMIGGIQTHGQLSQWHPHLHCLATYGAFTLQGSFIPLPEGMSTEPFLKIWEKKIFKLLLTEGLISRKVIENMRSWRHSGFSVDKSVAISAGDTAGLQRLAEYMLRCPFSLDRIISVNDDGKVVYRAEKTECRPFPVLGNENLHKGTPRNFEVFDPLEFIAELTQHIPDPGMQLVRYFGWYSNKARGQRAKLQREKETEGQARIDISEEDTPYRKLCRMRWAALIKRVYEVDPLVCPKCGGAMKVVAFIEKRDQPDVIEKILKHCGIWERAPPRTSPAKDEPPEQSEFELEYVDAEEFLAAL